MHWYVHLSCSGDSGVASNADGSRVGISGICGGSGGDGCGVVR